MAGSSPACMRTSSRRTSPAGRDSDSGQAAKPLLRFPSVVLCSLSLAFRSHDRSSTVAVRRGDRRRTSGRVSRLGAVRAPIWRRTSSARELFERDGFTLWNGRWYAGHHTLGYSVLFPPFAALVGPTAGGALAAVAAAALFAAIARRHFGERAWIGSAWFAVGTRHPAVSGRLTFALGVAVGLAALLAYQQRPRVGAAGAGGRLRLASPVAGLFLALAGLALAFGGRSADGAPLAWPALWRRSPSRSRSCSPRAARSRSPSRRSGRSPLLALAAVVFLAPEEKVLRVRRRPLRRVRHAGLRDLDAPGRERDAARRAGGGADLRLRPVAAAALRRCRARRGAARCTGSGAAAVRDVAHSDGRPVGPRVLLRAAAELPRDATTTAREGGDPLHAPALGGGARRAATSRWRAGGSVSSTASTTTLFYDGACARDRYHAGWTRTACGSSRCPTRGSTTPAGARRGSSARACRILRAGVAQRATGASAAGARCRPVVDGPGASRPTSGPAASTLHATRPGSCDRADPLHAVLEGRAGRRAASRRPPTGGRGSSSRVPGRFRGAAGFAPARVARDSPRCTQPPTTRHSPAAHSPA